MGYRTKYTLTTTPPNCRETICAALASENWGSAPFGVECKWYEHADHIEAVSAQFPAVVISVMGQGEDAWDRWVLHALGGTTVLHKRADWTPPPPSAEMLDARLAACGVAGPEPRCTCGNALSENLGVCEDCHTVDMSSANARR